jgi:hypothetical protein
LPAEPNKESHTPGLTNLTKFSARVTFRVWRSFGATHGTGHDKPYKPYKLFRQKKFPEPFFLVLLKDEAFKRTAKAPEAAKAPKRSKKSVRFVRFVGHTFRVWPLRAALTRLKLCTLTL